MKPAHDFSRYMSRIEFEDITSNIRLNEPQIATESLEQRDPYHEVRRFVDEFNAWRKRLVEPGPYLTVDESISAWDGLEYKYSVKGCPGLTYIPRKPKSRGVELKACCDGQTNVMLFIEIQEGKARMAKKEPVEWITLLGQAVATTLRLIVNWANTGRIVIGDSWFGSFKCLVALHAYVGFYAILIVKQSHRLFPLQYLKDWGSTITRAEKGSHKVLKT